MPKKKKGGKKKKKGGADEMPEETTDPLYDTMDKRTLEQVVMMLRQQLAKARLERNYVQLERDTTQTFFDISKSEVAEVSEVSEGLRPPVGTATFLAGAPEVAILGDCGIF